MLLKREFNYDQYSVTGKFSVLQQLRMPEMIEMRQREIDENPLKKWTVQNQVQLV